ncbi:MAG TPA: S46 family peptidase [Bacteroidales bacterium]|nr:S46 family peptidase [Bacteroidales bacterium]
MKKILIPFIAFILLVSPLSRADEGMWIPILIEQFNIKLMQEKGFKLSAEDIYSVNQACMKDAVMILGGCTAEMISPEGLVITNHHCGYGRIQAHSTLENDYLTNGFWAMSKEEELSNPGFNATFLKWMEDVTDKVLQGVNDKMSEDERNRIINTNIDEIVAEATEANSYSAFVRPFYMGNQFFLFVSETFRDVRLVGAPPSAIGKFGGETDNWMWPRHTGDFSIFRIYADKDNSPADYSEANVPYKPLYYFPISLKGVREGDFTMVFGYPGGTSQYVPSYHITMLTDYLYPKMIDLRTRKLDIIIADMEADPLVRIQYSAKKSGIANSWKRWIGEETGMAKLKTAEKKEAFERGFTNWVTADQNRMEEYGAILNEYKKLYDEYRIYNLVNSYSIETLGRSGIEAVSFAGSFASLVRAVNENAGDQEIRRSLNMIGRRAPGFFKDYSPPTDMKLFISLMELYGSNLDEKWWAQEYIDIYNSCKGDFASIAGNIYGKSIFTDAARFEDFVEGFSSEAISIVENDPLYKLAVSLDDFISENVRPSLSRLGNEIAMLDRLYMKAQMEYVTDRVLWPDANRTLRVAYGNIGGYEPRDAVYHTHYTTLKGIMEKDNPEIYDYDVPEKLRELYRNKDYGRYAQDGEIPVCFIANNHTTGGNSGSPVINADGHLIGINFDRAWEGVMSDFMYNPEQSRNISIDIRFALFIIDKFAGAGYLLEEMTLVE